MPGEEEEHFFGIGWTCACFQEEGKLEEQRDSVNNLASTGANSGEHLFRISGWISSGPTDFVVSSCFRTFSTSPECTREKLNGWGVFVRSSGGDRWSVTIVELFAKILHKIFAFSEAVVAIVLSGLVRGGMEGFVKLLASAFAKVQKHFPLD